MRKLSSCRSFGAARAASLLSVALLATICAGFASGEIIANLQPLEGVPGVLSDTQSYTLDYINEQGGIIVGDKLFELFTVTTTKSVGAIAPGIGEIAVTPISIHGDLGFKFNSGWSASAGQLADSTIQFHAVILPDYAAMGYAFKDNSLYMTAYGNETESGQVSVSENLYADYPGLGGESFANKFIFYKTDEDKKLLDQKEFAPITDMWVIKDVVANGGVGTLGAVHLSEFYQTFSQVPEPGTFALLGIGALGLAGFAIRRRRMA